MSYKLNYWHSVFEHWSLIHSENCIVVLRAKHSLSSYLLFLNMFPLLSEEEVQINHSPGTPYYSPPLHCNCNNEETLALIKGRC
jgi:hypothetical protein